MPDNTFSPPAPRKIGLVNWIGLFTLTRKETERFLVVYWQTVFAPVITTLLYYLVFSIALGGASREVHGINLMTFLAPGLIMMSMAQNAFANTSSSMVISKVMGNIVDVLMPPLTATEFATGYILGGIIRGLTVGLVSVICLSLIAPMYFYSVPLIVFHAVMGSMLLALLGFIGGIWAGKFDHLAAVTNFVIMPATFLSGTFYTSSQLPEAWRFLCHLNPFFYMIDGFRYGFTGFSDSPLITGVAVMLTGNFLLWTLSLFMLKTGYRLKT